MARVSSLGEFEEAWNGSSLLRESQGLLIHKPNSCFYNPRVLYWYMSFMGSPNVVCLNPFPLLPLSERVPDPSGEGEGTYEQQRGRSHREVAYRGQAQERLRSVLWLPLLAHKYRYTHCIVCFLYVSMYMYIYIQFVCVRSPIG